jgi:hypothetical protein
VVEPSLVVDVEVALAFLLDTPMRKGFVAPENVE